MMHSSLVVFILLAWVGLSLASVETLEQGKELKTVSPSQSPLASIYPYSSVAHDNFFIFWKLIDDQTIEVAAYAAQTTGWISVGFGAYDGGHCRSDMIVAINGRIQDRYSIKQDKPVEDKKYNIISGYVNYTSDGQIMTFVRQLKTSDLFEDRQIYTSMTTKVVWAWGPSDGDDMQQHPGGGYGTLWINFGTGKSYKYSGGLIYPVKIFFPLAFLIICFIFARFISTQPMFYYFRREYFIVHFFKYSIFEMLMMVLWIGANVIVFFVFRDPRKELGVNFAVPAEISISLLFITVLKSPFFNEVFGISYEKQIKYHRFYSWIAVIAVCIHMIVTLVNFGSKKIISDELTWDLNIFGLVSGGFMVLIALLALRFVRRGKWEVFKFPHFLFYLFFIFGALHDKNVAFFCLPGLALYIFDRGFRLFMKFFRIPTLTKVDTHCENMAILTIDNFRRKYQPGQFVEITFPEISKTQTHPFSISSSPAEDHVTIHAKSLGHWTSKIYENHATTKIWVDGPYGVKPKWRKYEVVVLFAGGIGATPWISIIRDHLLTPFTARPGHVYFYPTFHDTHDLSWFEDTWQMAKQDPSVTVVKYITSGKSNEMLEMGEAKDESVQSGRPKYHELLSEICKTHAGAQKILVMACGPGKMVRQIQKECYIVGKQYSKKLQFFSEVFKF